MDLNLFTKLPLMGILRGITVEAIEPLAETIISSGLQTIEVTMNTANAPALIKELCRASHGRFTVGAGTVLNLQELHAALNAGATFIVMPTLVTDVTARCARDQIPVFPGALTPQEIHNAWSAGATMVKVFPSKFFGPSYFSEIRGPFQDVKLLACGGITPKNIGSYIACGAAATSFGASIFKPTWITASAWGQIETTIKELITAYQASI
ncbi:MAG: bifunctional 4-hydroxy-2-oxoglutarate aldolase/2-dehydro-3-deoxy-phosphogluconate aldolase [Deltaproteobacteria bacterium]|nr:bifunctional 4-hydroxy-2-oxoglutarate aldolase/2-dehydro-3-deoxy-phosphogluconate aldolase [Deltaproteobacteria bacterium]